MAAFHIIFATTPSPWPLAALPPGDIVWARSRLLDQCWRDRRSIAWRVAHRMLPSDTDVSNLHAATMRVDRADLAEAQSGVISLSIDVAAPDLDAAIAKAKRLLDMPIAPTLAPRPIADGSTLSSGSFCRVRGDTIIGPMPSHWPIGRMITAYSHHLGSYGQGGVGLSGWQLNGGSWMILPLRNSDSWITLTKEELSVSRDRAELNIRIDQRIIGVHPNQRQDFTPWEHRYAGHDPIQDLPDFAEERARIVHFETSIGGFVLEAENGPRSWRFAIGDHLPRPIWAGSREARLFHENESVAEAFLLAHDCYLDV